MTDKKSPLNAAEELRRRAEEIFREKAGHQPEDLKKLSPEEIRRMLHELEVHQIELEMQNVELRRSQEELAASKDSYFDLYNLAPVGYFTVNKAGLIEEVNLNACTLLGVNRGKMLKRPLSKFILRDDEDIYYRQCKLLPLSGETTACELRMVRPDGTFFWGHLEFNSGKDSTGAIVTRMVVRDITERKKLEAAIIGAAEDWQRTFDSSRDMIMLLAPDMTIVKANRTISEFLKVPINQIVGKKCYEIFHGTDCPPAFCPTEKLKKDGQPSKVEIFLEAKGFWGEVTADPIYGENGGLAGIVHTIRDVTERKKAEAKLSILHEQHTYLTKYANDFIILLDENFNFLETNERVADFYGYTREELLRMCATDLRAPETKLKFAGQIKIAQTEGKTLYETVHQRKDGSKFPVEISIHRFDADGKRLYQAIIRDISARRRAEALLALEQEKAQKYFDAAAVIMLVLDLEGGVIKINEKGCEVLDCKKEEIEGKNFFDHFIPEKVREEVRSVYHRIMNGEEGLLGYYENLIVTKQGEEKLISWKNTIIKDDTGKVVSVLSSGEDITSRKRSENRLRVLNAAFLMFCADPDKNISYLTEVLGSVLGATCALYSRLEAGMLCVVGNWNAPADLKLVDKPEGHICYDVIRSDKKSALIRNLQDTDYARSDPNVKRYGLQTYFGQAVMSGGNRVGSLCAVFQKDFVPSEEDTRLLEIVSFAIQVEEDRRGAEAKLKQAELESRAILDNIPDMAWLKDKEGRFIAVNEALGKICGFVPKDLIGKKDLDVFPKEVADKYRADDLEVMSTGRKKSTEEGIIGKEGVITWAETIKMPTYDEKGEVVGTVGIARDITGRKKMEVYKDLARETLQILNEPGELKDSIQRVLATVKAQTGFDAVGIRLQDGEDFPYFAQEGFPKDFLQTENTLLEHTKEGGIFRDQDGKVRLECTCGLVISGKADLAHPLFTRGGSFWTNNSFPLVDLPPDQDPRFHPRNQCMRQGFASMALVPIRDKDKIVGLLHMNDRRTGSLTPEVVEFLEGIASHIGAAMMRKRAEAALQTSEERFKLLFTFAPDAIYLIDFNGKFIDGNAAAEKIAGCKKEELIGKTYFEAGMLPLSQAPKVLELLAKNILGQSAGPTELALTRKDGSAVSVEIRTYPVKIQQETVIMGIARDVTARKAADGELAKHLRELEIFYNVSEGREERIVELKKEIEKLKRERRP